MISYNTIINFEYNFEKAVVEIHIYLFLLNLLRLDIKILLCHASWEILKNYLEERNDL